MEGDLSTVVKIGIGLVILVFIVGIVFSVVKLGRNIANSGADQLESSLDQLSNSQLDDFDQHTVTGTRVSLAIKQFDKMPLGIVVVTGMCQQDNVMGGYCYGQLLDGYTATGDRNNVAYKSATALKRKDGSTLLTAQMASPKKYNANTKPTLVSGSQQFIRPNAIFLGELLEDNTGTTVGIQFTQMQE